MGNIKHFFFALQVTTQKIEQLTAWIEKHTDQEDIADQREATRAKLPLWEAERDEATKKHEEEEKKDQPPESETRPLEQPPKPEEEAPEAQNEPVPQAAAPEVRAHAGQGFERGDAVIFK